MYAIIEGINSKKIASCFFGNLYSVWSNTNCCGICFCERCRSPKINDYSNGNHL